MKFLLALFCLALTVPLSAKTAKVKKPSVESLKHSLKPEKATLTVKKPALQKPPPGYEEAKFELPPVVWLTTAYSRGMFRNITAPPFKPRGPVYLPKGSTNVALSKPVTSSDERPKTGTLGMVTDGDKKWEEGSQLELASGTQWVQIDLQKPHIIHGILLWHYAGLGAVYRDVVVQLADDPDFVTNLRTVYNNDDNNSSGLGVGKDREFYENWPGQWIPIKTEKASYVRLYSNGNTRDPINRYTEVEVWGTPLPGYKVAKFVLPRGPYGSFPYVIRSTTAPAWRPRGKVFLPKGSTNVALHKPVTSSDDFPIIGTVSGVTDGEKGFTEGYWVELGPGTQWVQIDLQAKFKIHGILLWHYFGAPNRVYRDVSIRLADDAEFTKNVRTLYNNDQDNSSKLGAGKDREFYEHETGQWISFETQTARYIRLYSRGNTSDPQNHYVEVEVWGQPTK